MKRNQINKEVEKTLNSSNSLEKYEGNPFLFTRIEAEINSIEAGSLNYSTGKKLILLLQPVGLAFILFLNIWTAATFFSDQSHSSAMRDIELDILLRNMHYQQILMIIQF